MRSSMSHVPLVVALCAGLALNGCGGADKPAPRPSTPASTAAQPSTPPPPVTAAQVKSALLGPSEIGGRTKESQVSVQAMSKRQAPMCSLTGLTIPGKPQLTTRQFYDSRDPEGGVKYAQLVGLYADGAAAKVGYEALRTKATACPKKQHVPRRKLRGNLYFLAHDDTWETSQDDVAGWTHLRGFEKHVESAGGTTDNIYYFVYDYAVRGNVLLTTLYWERTKTGGPVAERATEVLAKQLRKFG